MFWVFVFVIIVFVLWYKGIRKPAGFPPGPPSLPIVGSLPFIKLARLHEYLEGAREKYGPVVGFKLGFRNCIAFCGPKEVQECLRIEELQGRPNITIASRKAKHGIILTEGQFWSTQRRFTLRHLRDFGFGKASIEGLIVDEINEFFHQRFYKTNKIQVDHLFNNSIINVLWAVMAGQRFEQDDKDFQILFDALNTTFRTGGFTNGPVFFRRYIRSLIGWDEEIECEKVLSKFIQDTIDEHKQTITDEPRDFIDVYLKEIEKQQDPNFNELVLESICIDLFTAGTESVGNSLGFCIMYLVLYPEWQDRLFNELKSVIGDNRISLTDKPRLPQLEAFWSEVSRTNTIAPIAVPRRAMADVKYKDYFIAKNTFVIVSIWSLMKDKQHWKDPENFRPQRFLNSEGAYVKDEWLSAFGAGKRQCPGESLARNALFLFLAMMVREFKFSIPDGEPAPITEALGGFTTAPRPFTVSVTQRK